MAIHKLWKIEYDQIEYPMIILNLSKIIFYDYNMDIFVLTIYYY